MEMFDECICRYCGEKLYQDDIDYNFKGNYDLYFVCELCKISCTREIRFYKIYKEYWFNDEGCKILESDKWKRCFNPYID